MDKKQIKMWYVALVFAMFVFGMTFLPNPGITGHVLMDAGYQILDISVDESQVYVMSSDYEDPLTITSLRLSGEIIGEGKAEVYLDNGAGQKLLLYSNILDSREVNHITGMAVADEEDIEEKALLNLIPAEKTGYIDAELEDGVVFDSGKFANRCKETCIINMELSKDINYKLEFKVSEGVELRLEHMIYGLLLE